MIRLKNVYKEYKQGSFFSRRYITVLRDVSVGIRKGEHVGIIGESGAGKSTLCRILSLLELPTKGEVYIKDRRITRKNIRKVRGTVGMVFQDPSTSLDPTMSIRSILREAKKIENVDMEKWLLKVGFDKNIIDEEFFKRKPYQLSGGQQQRLAILRALLGGAECIVFDEFTSALDISTQAKIVNMLCSINKDKKYTFVFVSHDVNLVNYLSDRVYVIYRGEIVEENKGTGNFVHPYSVLLVKGEAGVYRDSIYTESDKGCGFYSLCPYRKEICKKERPKLVSIDKNVKVRCFLYD